MCDSLIQYVQYMYKKNQNDAGVGFSELEILDIRKELKDLLLVHHATIKDLQKQVSQMHRKIATIDNSKKSAKIKTTAKKSTRNKKTASSKKSKKKSSQKKNRKR